MTRTALVAAIAAVLSLGIASTGAAQTADDALARLQWLTGCWAGTAGSDGVEENWMPLSVQRIRFGFSSLGSLMSNAI